MLLDEAIELDFVTYDIEDPKITSLDSLRNSESFSAALYVTFKLKDETGNKKERVYMGELPMMTRRGTFIINGAERVVVSQLIRSPGVYFTVEEDRVTDRRLCYAKLIPNRGAWLEFETSKRDVLSVKVDRKRKFPVSTLLRAVGIAGNEDLLAAFADVDTDEDHPFVASTLEKDPTTDEESALMDIYHKLRPGDPLNAENARAYLTGLLFNERRYDLGRVGRYKLDRKLHYSASTSEGRPMSGGGPRPQTLTRDDLRAVVAHMIMINNRRANEDDIDTVHHRSGPDRRDWDVIGAFIQARDPYSHLISAHNIPFGIIYPDRHWLTHVSYQHPDTHTLLLELLAQYHKPVINDEYQYEGNLRDDWGNSSPELVLERHWKALMAGGDALLAVGTSDDDRLDPHERYLLRAIGKGRSLEALRRLSRLGPGQTDRTLHLLLCLGLAGRPAPRDPAWQGRELSPSEVDRMMSAFRDKSNAIFKYISKELGPFAQTVLGKALEEVKPSLGPLFESVALQADGTIEFKSPLKININLLTEDSQAELARGLTEILSAEVLAVKKSLGNDHEAALVRHLEKVGEWS